MKSFIVAVLSAIVALASSQQAGIRGSIQNTRETSSSSSSSPCKSIIAIGSTVDHRSDDSSSTTSKVSISFDTSSDGIREKTDEQFVCILQDGSDVPLDGTVEQMDQLRRMLNNGTLVSGMSVVDAVEQEAEQESELYNNDDGDEIQMMRARSHPDAASDHDLTFDYDSINYNTVNESPSSNTITSLKLPPGPIHIYTPPNSNTNSQSNERQLASYHGIKPILAVKVIDKNGLQHPDSAKTISDKIFGTHGDESTMTSQFAACSFGKLQIVPAFKDDDSKQKLLADAGVLEVQIPIDIRSSSQGSIRKEVKAAIENKLGMGLPKSGVIDHVMVILEGCYVECGWSAYAFVNSWLSVYKGNNYKYPAVQLHEIGHNLNMAHSGGLDGKIYTDHTCVMGNPLFSDDVGRMCFNAAKNYQFAKAGAWYNDKPEYTISWDSGKRAGTGWSGRLIGVAEYDNNPNDDPIAIRIVTGSDRDLFLGFNRQTGMNADVKYGGDEVTLIEAGNGNNYAQSFLKRVMEEGDRYEIEDWRKSKETLTITVHRIDTAAVPGYAEVTIAFGPQPPPTNSPTNLPTSMPSANPTASPSTHPTPAPTSSTSQLALTFPPSSQTPSASPVAGTRSNSITMSPVNPSTSPSNAPTTQSPSFSPTTRPTHNPAPSSPEIIEYLLDHRDSKGSAKGMKFTIRARRDVVITGFDVFPRKSRSCQMRVYTQPGDYRYNNKDAIMEENIESGWTTVFDSNMEMKLNRLAGIRVDRGDEVFIPQWEVQSFIIYCNRGMVVAPGRQRDEGITFSENEDIEVREGVKSKKAFSKETGYAQLMGKVRYYVK